jgi:hypothetical protein
VYAGRLVALTTTFERQIFTATGRNDGRLRGGERTKEHSPPRAKIFLIFKHSKTLKDVKREVGFDF